MKTILVAALASLLLAAGAIAEVAPATTKNIQLAQAASCSAWKTICEGRGPGCAAKFSQCMKSGCWTEGQAYGGKTHCGLAKK